MVSFSLTGDTRQRCTITSCCSAFETQSFQSKPGQRVKQENAVISKLAISSAAGLSQAVMIEAKKKIKKREQFKLCLGGWKPIFQAV